MDQRQINRIAVKDRTDASQRQKAKGKKRRHRAIRRIGKLVTNAAGQKLCSDCGSPNCLEF